jgi:hypothetical protein
MYDIALTSKMIPGQIKYVRTLAVFLPVFFAACRPFALAKTPSLQKRGTYVPGYTSFFGYLPDIRYIHAAFRK